MCDCGCDRTGAAIAPRARPGRRRVRRDIALVGDDDRGATLDQEVRVMFGDGHQDLTFVFARGGQAHVMGRVQIRSVDAAHMHLPARGVGLKVGVQDTMNLGWRLASVVQSAPRSACSTATARAPSHGRGLAGEQQRTDGADHCVCSGSKRRGRCSASWSRRTWGSLALAAKLGTQDVTYCTTPSRTTHDREVRARWRVSGSRRSSPAPCGPAAGWPWVRWAVRGRRA